MFGSGHVRDMWIYLRYNNKCFFLARFVSLWGSGGKENPREYFPLYIFVSSLE